MKRTWIVAAALTAFAALPAVAADMQMPMKAAAAPVAVYNWTGFYIGVNAGGGMASSRFDDPCFYCSSATPTSGFFTGGGQIGANYQFGAGLIGIEADVNWNSSFKDGLIGGDDTNALRVNNRAEVSGTVRARAGLVMSNAMVYVTGGFAWANIDQTGIEISNRFTNVIPVGLPTGITANASHTAYGAVIGAGVEFMLSPNWIVGMEYLHTMYEDTRANLINANRTSSCGTNLPASSCFIGSQLTTDVGRVRASYKF